MHGRVSAMGMVFCMRAAQVPHMLTRKSLGSSSMQRVKPPNVDETRWRQALAQAGGPNNPDR